MSRTTLPISDIPLLQTLIKEVGAKALESSRDLMDDGERSKNVYLVACKLNRFLAKPSIDAFITSRDPYRAKGLEDAIKGVMLGTHSMQKETVEALCFYLKDNKLPDYSYDRWKSQAYQLRLWQAYKLEKLGAADQGDNLNAEVEPTVEQGLELQNARLELDQLRNDKIAATEKITDLEQQLQDKQKDILKNKTLIKELSLELDQLRNDKITATEKIATLQQQLQGKKDKILKNKTLIEELSLELEQLKKNLITANQTIETLEQLLKDKQDEMTIVKAANERLTNTLKKLRTPTDFDAKEGPRLPFNLGKIDLYSQTSAIRYLFVFLFVAFIIAFVCSNEALFKIDISQNERLKNEILKMGLQNANFSAEVGRQISEKKARLTHEHDLSTLLTSAQFLILLIFYPLFLYKTSRYVEHQKGNIIGTTLKQFNVGWLSTWCSFLALYLWFMYKFQHENALISVLPGDFFTKAFDDMSAETQLVAANYVSFNVKSWFFADVFSMISSVFYFYIYFILDRHSFPTTQNPTRHAGFIRDFGVTVCIAIGLLAFQFVGRIVLNSDELSLLSQLLYSIFNVLSMCLFFSRLNSHFFEAEQWRWKIYVFYIYAAIQAAYSSLDTNNSFISTFIFLIVISSKFFLYDHLKELVLQGKSETYIYNFLIYEDSKNNNSRIENDESLENDSKLEKC